MNDIEKRALAAVEAGREELFALLAQLIRFDSQNLCGDGREQALAEYMAQRYRALGMETELYCPDSVPGVCESPLYWPGHNTAHRPNATGVLRGVGGCGSVMLAAHTDTMPVGDLSAWRVPPFGGVIRDGRIYGLGAGDNKSGLAAALFALSTVLALGVPLRRDVILTAYCDEEFGGGNGALAACVKYPCDDVINLDGGNYELWAAALGGGCFRIVLEREGTSDDCAPVYRALSLLMQALEAFGGERRRELAANRYYAGTDMQRSAFRIASFGSLPDSHTKASVDFVLYTTRTREQIRSELDAILASLSPAWREMGVHTQGFMATTRFFDYMECDAAQETFSLLHACAQEAAGRPVRVCGSCLTDLSVIMAQHGARACNFGILRDFSLPGGAHQPDEYVECSQLEAYTKALTLFLLRHCT